MEFTSQPTGNDSRDQFLRVLRGAIEESRMPLDQRLLIVGGSAEDEETLRRAGFKHIVNSNLPSDAVRIGAGKLRSVLTDAALDAEQLELPDESFDAVFAHAVLHHCSSPHHALCEMLRVCRRYVLFMEPNDSLAMSLLVKLGFSFPYETAAVIDHDYRSGGVRDSQIPNFIYRWNRKEVLKTVSSYIPERLFTVRTYPYWDFSLTEEAIDARKETRLGSITALTGTENLLALLKLVQGAFNQVPLLRKQGNRIFCCVEKGQDLRPWLARNGEGIVFNRHYQRDG